MFAIIETGGKQYKVAPGDRLAVERLDYEPGSTVEFSCVLIGDGGRVTVGHPALDGAKVLAYVIEHDRADKITVFKYKAKSNYRRKTGHRQSQTHVRVTEIREAGPLTPALPSGGGEGDEDGALAPIADISAEESGPPPGPRPRRRRGRATAEESTEVTSGT